VSSGWLVGCFLDRSRVQSVTGVKGGGRGYSGQEAVYVLVAISE